MPQPVPQVRSVVDRLDLRELVADAWVCDSPDGRSPGPRTLDVSFLPAVLWPWQLFLDLASGDGIRVTERAYLAPDAVRQLFDELGLASTRGGRGNRERDVPEVRQLRRTCRRAGLARSTGGRIRLTARGLAAQQDPKELWAALASSLLPAADGSLESEATALAVLHLAADLPWGPETERRVAADLAALGHRVGGRHPDAYDVVRAASEASTTLGWLMDEPYALGLLEDATPVQRALARAAVFGA